MNRRGEPPVTPAGPRESGTSPDRPTDGRATRTATANDWFADLPGIPVDDIHDALRFTSECGLDRAEAVSWKLYALDLTVPEVRDV
jgi:hypothetical protein